MQRQRPTTAELCIETAEKELQGLLVSNFGRPSIFQLITDVIATVKAQSSPKQTDR